MNSEQLPDLNAECFFIAPIGSEGSETRDRSDGILEYIVTPAAEAVGLTTIRADKIAKPGQITRQVIEHVVGARAAVVDLTDANPNVYYEMAIRHTAQSPTVLIAQDGEKLPFDIAQMRTIFFDPTSLKSAAACQEQISQHLKEALDGEVDSPIAASMSVQKLGQGNEQERVLAQIVDGMDDLRRQIRVLRHQQDHLPPGFIRDLDLALHELMIYRDRSADGDPAIEEIIHHLRRPMTWASGRPYGKALERRRREAELNARVEASETDHEVEEEQQPDEDEAPQVVVAGDTSDIEAVSGEDEDS
jgi:hypothetical protein